MTLYIPKFDVKGIPAAFPLYRVPLQETGKWGIRYDNASDLKKLLEMDRSLYKKEWEMGKGAQMDNVTKASEEAGFGPMTKVLQKAGGALCSYLCDKIDGEIVILDNGAGPGQSARKVADSLTNREKSRVKILLLDPSGEKLAEAKRALGTEIEYEALPPCSDYEALEKTNLKPGEVDIVLNVAGGKHHNMLAPWGLYKDILKQNGYFVDIDWNTDCWRPAIVYDMMDSWEWEDKEEILKGFADMFIPELTGNKEMDLELARKRDYSENELDAQAVKDMISFWTGYGRFELKSGAQGKHAIFWPEGHMNSKKILEYMTTAGLNPNSDDLKRMKSEGLEIDYSVIRGGSLKEGKTKIKDFPHNICPDTSLWSINIGQKESK